MPQLDHVTYFTQLFWLIASFLSFYVIILKFFLPEIGRILKIRKKKLESEQSINTQLQELREKGYKKTSLMVLEGTLLKTIYKKKFINEAEEWFFKSSIQVYTKFFKKLDKDYENTLETLKDLKIYLLNKK